MTVLQRQARALGDPTRHRIFQFIAAESEAVDVARLTSHFALNHNAIRQHLAKLVETGLIEEDKAVRTSPGRPRLVYRMAPSTDSKWGAVGPYERLSTLLVEIIRTGKTAREVGREFGRRLRTPDTSSVSTVTSLAATMQRQGFDPVLTAGKTSADIVLRTCPFAATALADRSTVCALHLGLAEGLAEGTDVQVERLVARDPRTAQCRLRVRTAAGESATPGDLVLVGGSRATKT